MTTFPYKYVCGILWPYLGSCFGSSLPRQQRADAPSNFDNEWQTHEPGPQDYFEAELDDEGKRELENAIRVDQAARQEAFELAQGQTNDKDDDTVEEPRSRRRRVEGCSAAGTLGISDVARCKRQGVTCMHCT